MMLDYIYSLLLEVNLHFGLRTITQVRHLLENTTIPDLFEQTLQPILVTNKSCDIPELNEVTAIFDPTMDKYVSSLERTASSMSIAAAQHKSWYNALIMMAYIFQFTGEDRMQPHEMIYTACLVLKLAVGLFRYREENGGGADWEEYSYLDKSDVEESDSEEELEEDDEDA